MHRLPVRNIATRRILPGPEYMSQQNFGPELVELATGQNNLCKMNRLIQGFKNGYPDVGGDPL